MIQTDMTRNKLSCNLHRLFSAKQKKKPFEIRIHLYGAHLSFNKPNQQILIIYCLELVFLM